MKPLKSLRFIIAITILFLMMSASLCRGMEITPALEGESDYITWILVDDNYIYLVCEVCEEEDCDGEICVCKDFTDGYMLVYDHDLAYVDMISSDELMTGSTYVKAMESSDDYLYLGMRDGTIAQIEKATLTRSGSCLPGEGDYFGMITGIVDNGDGYIYASTYMSDEQFHKIDPSTMEVVASFWAPDSTHSLAGDGTYLYSITCRSGERDLEWGEYTGTTGGGLLLILDPVTMTGHDIIHDDFDELGQGLVVGDGRAYFAEEDNDLIKVNLETKAVEAESGDCPPEIELINRMFLTCGGLYLEGDATKSSADGFAVFAPSDLTLTEHVDSDQKVYSIYEHDDQLYISYGDYIAIEGLTCYTPTPTPTPMPTPTSTPPPTPAGTPTPSSSAHTGFPYYEYEQYERDLPRGLDLKIFFEPFQIPANDFEVWPEDNPPFPTDDDPRPFPLPYDTMGTDRLNIYTYTRETTIRDSRSTSLLTGP